MSMYIHFYDDFKMKTNLEQDNDENDSFFYVIHGPLLCVEMPMSVGPVGVEIFSK